MEILNKILRAMTLEEFLQKHFHRLPLSVSGNVSDFEQYMNWSVIEHILCENKSMLRIVKEGKMVVDDAKVSIQKAQEFYHSGHTLVIKNSEKSHPQLSQLAQEFSSFFFAPVDIQLFCSPSNASGFGWHYDIEDVFIFQTQGSKNFTLRQNTINHHPTTYSTPHDQGFENETSDLYVDVKLVAGDWLYIPAGWWHKASALEEGSMHISLGVLSKTASDILPILLKILSQNSFWKSRLPLYQKFDKPEEEVAFYQEGMKELGKDVLKNLSDKEVVQEIIKQLRGL